MTLSSSRESPCSPPEKPPERKQPEKQTKDRLWTIQKIINWSEDYFGRFDIDSPRLTAEILLAHTLGIRRLDLYLQFDRPLNREELATYKTVIRRRVHLREPVAYIVGEKGFWESDFRVSPHVLIPRPDTEILVETAVKEIKARENSGKRLSIVDLGTGSGAIAISLAAACRNHMYYAVDVSVGAVNTAHQNYRKVFDGEPDGQERPAVHFLAGSWLSGFNERAVFDVMVSNPPYIPTKEIETLQPEIKDHEPLTALDGGEDGLDAHRHILELGLSYLEKEGVLLMEMGADQRGRMEEEAARIPGFHPPEFIKDYAGHDRVVILKPA